MTPIHYSIKSVLLPICLETTEKFRPTEVADPARQKRIDSIIAAAKVHLPNFQARDDFQRYILGIFAVALDLPELQQTKSSYVAPLCVVVPIGNSNAHTYSVGVPHIVIHGTNGQLLDSTGDSRSTILSSDLRVATEEEVEACLDTLTAEQLKTIMTHEVFAPFVEQLFSPQTELVPADKIRPDDVIVDGKGE